MQTVTVLNVQKPIGVIVSYDFMMAYDTMAAIRKNLQEIFGDIPIYFAAQGIQVTVID